MLPLNRLARCDHGDPRFVSALAAADLPVCGRDGHCYVLADGSGFGVIEGKGTDRLLRSVVVPAAQRGMGVGTQLVDLLIEQAARLGADRLWLLTTTAADFFHRRGWKAVPRDAAPLAIRASDQFTSLCPSSATLMLRELAR
ncbi:MAG: GNAT family N-acetyltransferase [Sphingomonas sp.]|nr:GNAT family N-acetyltransferase [Sphingomonas sp.]